jgi:cysteinyl-tRNA synthetase
MTLKIYNTLSRKVENFKPIEEKKVKMYVCGMTVYSDAHIGHARTYFAFDLIRRYLEYKNYKVYYIQNITDVDDKIINAANKEGIDALEYSKRFTDRCLNDLDRLGIRRADLYPKASETIPDMIKMIQIIISRGFAYVSDGDVYFSVEKFKDYGKLSGQKIDDMKAGARIELDEQKHNPFDFALWKKAKPGEPSWDSPWGKGRPGWHIECSTMSGKFLGIPFDIHGGGMDLRFPHHENEIAQAEAATGKDFAKYWIHIGLLTVNGEKMSKSLGNIVNVKDLLNSWDPEVLRFFFAQTQYRSPPDFNEKALKNAEKGLIRIRRLKENLEKISGDVRVEKINEKDLTKDDKKFLKIINDFIDKFEKSMDEDFNTPMAISVIFDFINKSNRYINEQPSPNNILCSYALFKLVQLGKILTLFQPSFVEKKEIVDKVLFKKLMNIIMKYDKDAKGENLDDLLDLILKLREKARKNKDYKTSDNIRKELEDIGFEIQDTLHGPVWRKR